MSFCKAKFDVVIGCRTLFIYRMGFCIARYEYYGDEWNLVYCRNMKYYFAVETEKEKALARLGESEVQVKQSNIDWRKRCIGWMDKYGTLETMVKEVLQPILATFYDKIPEDAFKLLVQIQGHRLCNCGRYECERRTCECEKAPIDKCDVKE